MLEIDEVGNPLHEALLISPAAQTHPVALWCNDPKWLPMPTASHPDSTAQGDGRGPPHQSLTLYISILQVELRLRNSLSSRPALLSL